MATSSGGVEWAQLIKPILAASYGTFNRQDLPELIKAVIKSKEEILHHDEEHESFYSAFAVLAADYISTNAHHITVGGLGQAVSAGKILLQYLTSRVGTPSVVVSLVAPLPVPPVSPTFTEESGSVPLTEISESPVAEKERSVTIVDKHLLTGISALCRGTGVLHRADQTILTAAMKAARLPCHVKTSTAGDKEPSTKEVRKGRSDPSAAILEQLVSPLHDIGMGINPRQRPAPVSSVVAEEKENDGHVSVSPSIQLDMRNLFASRCVAALQSVGGGEQLIDACLQLPTIVRFTQRYKDLLEGKGHGFPVSTYDAMQVKASFSQIVSELSTVWRVVSLPLLEPLSAMRLQKLATLAMSALLATLTVATAVAVITVSSQTASTSKTPPPREDELDSAAPVIAEKALDLFNVILNAVRSSTRAGGHHVQNLQLMGSWLLMTGLHQFMIVVSTCAPLNDKKEDKGRSPVKKEVASTRINLTKVQQGFGVVGVALASQGVTLMTGLLEDVKVEGWSSAKPTEPARLDPLETYSATERLARLFSAVPLNQLLFYLATVSYRKACSLKRTQRVGDGDTFSMSDSATYYDDDFSEGSLGDEDDDSVIIGSWFEEPVPTNEGEEPPAGGGTQTGASHFSTPDESQVKTPHRQNSELATIVPEKGEPHGFISLASHIFLLMNGYLVENECAYVHQYVRAGLSDTHMIVLAAIIRDLDKEMARFESGNVTTFLGPVLGSLYEEFSLSLYRYTHNVIASGLLNETLQNVLLAQLGVSPWTPDGDWPLMVLPRTLTVLAQILLLRQRRDKDELKCDSDTACVLIWNRFIATLTKSITITPLPDAELDDLNAEHAQLLLFLFHSLQLMQKKSVLLNVAAAVVAVNSVVSVPLRDLQVVHLARLLLVFEYLMKNLYEAPQSLIEQVQWNLFTPGITQSSNNQTSPDKENATGLIFNVWQELEQNYRQNIPPNDEPGIRPRFYTLTALDSNSQESPKLDGLACSFILATPDTLRYSALYDALVNLLAIGDQCDPSLRSATDPPLSFLGLCGVQYAFSMAYRLVLTMPPSVACLEMMSNPEARLEGCHLIHALLWGPRAAHKVFNGWIKDGLVRQSLTTQKADALLKSVTKTICNVKYCLRVASQQVSSLWNARYSSFLGSALTTGQQLPTFTELCLLDVLLAALQVSFEEASRQTDVDMHSCDLSDVLRTLDLTPDLLPVSALLKLIQSLAHAGRWNLLQQVNNLLEDDIPLSKGSLGCYSSVLAITGNPLPRAGSNPATFNRSTLPGPLKSLLENWNTNSMDIFPATFSWKSGTGVDATHTMTDGYVSAVLMGHISSLSLATEFSINRSLKHVLTSLLNFAMDVAGWYVDNKELQTQLISTLVGISADALFDHTNETLAVALDSLLPIGESIDQNPDQFQMMLYTHVLRHVETLVQSCVSADSVDEEVTIGCTKFLEDLLETEAGKTALDKFLTESHLFSVELILPVETSPQGTVAPSFTTHMIRFFIRLFQLAEAKPEDPTLVSLCARISFSSWLETTSMRQWLSSQLLGNPVGDSDAKLPTSWSLLKALTAYMVSQSCHGSEEVVTSLLGVLIPLGSEFLKNINWGLSSMTLLLSIMSTLASAGSGSDHVQLFRACVPWILQCKNDTTADGNPAALELMGHLLAYISDIVAALKISSDRWTISYRSGTTSPPCEGDINIDTDSDWVDEMMPDEEDSGAEDSDEDSMCNKLCTYMLTQKEFMHQHWYHCHTCRMVDGVGVCTVCARVCHRNHDVTYAKYGAFFCDCGAKEDRSCQALVKRSSVLYDDNVRRRSSGAAAYGAETLLPSLRRRTSSPQGFQENLADDTSKHRQALVKKLENSREYLVSELSSGEITNTVLSLVKDLLPTVQAHANQSSASGTYQRVLLALQQVHSQTKKVDFCDNLMTATLGSQEGAFENVRLNYSGEAGQTIRQLVTAHIVHRVAMCCLASPGGKRQHLAVSHEKGKITVLQLSSLLRQHDSANKRKLTLTRLSSAPVPFTVLSITANPANDNFLAVCGLKDCHILTFTSTGTVTDHLVLHPQLESGNYIIRAIWLPGQQTQLALITAEFVKIYDLSVDSLSPRYFFLLPSGKIKDACFVCNEDNGCYLVAMAFSGYIYTQVLCEESSARHGPFYVTNVLQVVHSDLKDCNGNVGGGGISVYYSHILQLLFFSYTSGRNFIAPLTSLSENTQLDKLTVVTLKGNNNGSGGAGNNNSGNGNGNGTNIVTVGKNASQPLCQWAEVIGHPGLITCLTQTSNNPVILMIKPESVSVQEIRVLPAKSKMTDLVALRHSWSPNHEAKTTLILLCEDGSLRIYNANPQATDYWISPHMQSSGLFPLRSSRKKKMVKIGRPTGSLFFPTDFFEHCSAMNEVEFGGNDLLQVYNIQQLKNRINSQGMYIASTKPGGFQLEVTNSDPTHVICGLRVAVGSVDPQRSPLFVEVFGRSVPTNSMRTRWFDIPLRRDESLQADKRIVITFGPSSDPSGVTIVDSVKIYGKSKDDFGWPEEAEDFPVASATAANSSTIAAGTTNPETAATTPSGTGDATSSGQVVTSLDRLVACALETLEGCIAGSSGDKFLEKSEALDVATHLLTLPLPALVQHHVRTLLSSLHQSRAAYYNHKDNTILSSAVQALSDLCQVKDSQELDSEMFCRLVAATRSVAVARPYNLVKYTEKSLETICIKIDPEPGVLDGELTMIHVGSTKTETDVPIESEELPSLDSIGDASFPHETAPLNDEPTHFLDRLASVFWALHGARPSNTFVAPVCKPGLNHIEPVVQAVIEIIHAYTTTSLAMVPTAVRLYSALLLSPDPAVSFGAKQALSRVLRPKHRRRRVFIPSPPRCSTPGDHSTERDKMTPVHEAPLEAMADVHHYEAVADVHFEAAEEHNQHDEVHGVGEGMDAMALFGGGDMGAVGGGGEGLMAASWNLPADDDDAMMELAIALSLHEEQGQAHGGGGGAGLHQGLIRLPMLHHLQGLGDDVLHSLQVLAAAGGGLPGAGQGSQHAEGGGDEQQDLGEDVIDADGNDNGHYSDTTASANGSDDEDGEGSTAATDGGSNLRASPAEQPGSAGSESGGSVMESLGGELNVSGRSSAYGDGGNDGGGTSGRGCGTAISGVGMQAGDNTDNESCQDLGVGMHSLRLALLDSLIQHIPSLSSVGGINAIPFFQVLLMLSSDLDGSDNRDHISLNALLEALVFQLHLGTIDVEKVSERSAEKEMQLVILRMLSVMLSRSKLGVRSAGESVLAIPQCTAAHLMRSGAMSHCLALLKALLEYWRSVSKEQAGTVISSNLLKGHPLLSPPDMAPFFLRQYVKGHSHDVFTAYAHLLTEMVLRLPYQIKKLGEGDPFEPAWSNYLCEYMMTQLTPVLRRQVRKLLLFICGNKDKYRQTRDLHSLDFHMKEVKLACTQRGFGFTGGSTPTPTALPYDSLIELIEHLKSCVDVATTHTNTWQRYCIKDENTLGFLIDVSYYLDEGVAPTVLQLLQTALCQKSADLPGTAIDSDNSVDPTSAAGHSRALVGQLNRFMDPSRLAHFVRTFLLESNSTGVRWQAHSLLLALYTHSSGREQEALLALLWELWPHVPSYGHKAAQFVDLLGYFSLKTHPCEDKVIEYLNQGAVGVLRTQSQLLSNHPNASLYNALSSLVEFDGYFLESEPCLVCNNPEVPFASIKLSTIKVDSRFTTTTQLVKLIGSHMISRLTLRVADLKRTKMVRTLNVFYNNRSVQAVVELKNKPSMWHKAKKITLSAGQVEVKVDFPLPIVACNLMFEYADFYENLQASTETLQCPRCSAAVPASPGVCGNCGENVYQCHKCRAINYDEKDPFLCNACGYCKYAKFDYTLQCRPCCAVDPIENEEDRKKAVLNINSLLDKADKTYKQLQSYKPTLELLVMRISEQGSTRAEEVGAAGGTSVNRAIQQLAQKYCSDCKNTFDELSKIIQRVQASRSELVAFDQSQRDGSRKTATVRRMTTGSAMRPLLPPLLSEAGGEGGITPSGGMVRRGRCYGCASAATEHCVTLMRALSTRTTFREVLIEQNLIQDLFEYNLRRGSVQARSEVRQLLCLLTKDSLVATQELNELIMNKISVALRSHFSSPDLSAAVHHEMALLAASAQKEDECWEHRLRCVMQLFLMAGGSNAVPTVTEHITLPCLRILQGVMRPPTPPPPRKLREKTPNVAPSVVVSSSLDLGAPDSTGTKVSVDIVKWLSGDPEHSFESWRKKTRKGIPGTPLLELPKAAVHERFLLEKYASVWLEKSIRRRFSVKVVDSSWLRYVLFNPSSRMARQVVAQIVESLCTSVQRKREILNMITSFLPEIGVAGESASEFVALYQSLLRGAHWKHYLALQGVLPIIASLIGVEIQHLLTLEDTTLTTDLIQGYTLKVLTELLSQFVEVDSIKSSFKGRLLGSVLSGYLSLRKLVIQRTKLVDDTQEILLELLEDMTSGTEAETREFMAVCVKTMKQYPPEDLRTPVFIYERLCSIIYPEENDVGEFFLTLEKDPQQEDFLQGRMVGNPYNSLDPGMGPLMRDVKNKICQDCELVALLEDDSGMELLVCNKIISLDLPVKEVYRKLWLVENSESDAMRVVYRMRGLLGDATEEFIETVDKKKEENVDNEQVFRMAEVMSQCGGLEVMLECLQRISDVSSARPLVTVILKLMQFCVKVRLNRERLMVPSLNAISTLLHTLKQCLAAEPEVVAGPPGGVSLTEQLLQVLEAVLGEASSMPAASYTEFVETCGTLEDIHLLLNYVATSSLTNAQVRQRLMRVLPFLVFCHKEKMELLVGHFRPVLDFERFDSEHSAEDVAKMESFCVFCDGIERNENGNQLKDMIIRANIVKDAVVYLESHIPVSKKLVEVCSDEWKEFLNQPSLKYILRLLTGLALKHRGTQQAVSSCIASIHRLEQISSDQHVGSVAENLLEALQDDPDIAKQVQEVRRQTRQEKKRLAMETRKKELSRLGLHANDKEQITSQSTLLAKMGEITEESGLVCAICLEGYRCQSQKVLAIYTFSKRCQVEEAEGKAHKTFGYCTVTHFNVVHVECHLAAVRSSRSRDEWESAALHNANTRANGLLPLWGPQVPESVYAACLARHNTYLQECTSHRDISFNSTLHDLKLLLLRFAQERSFSNDTGGGGRQSNVHLIPYILHMALYVINTTRVANREEKRLSTFVDSNITRWVEASYEAEGPFYLCVLALAVWSPQRWADGRLNLLRQVLVAAHVRAVTPQLPSAGHVGDKTLRDWSVYKAACVFWALVDHVYKTMFKKVTQEGDWSTNLAEFIRNNDQGLVESASRFLSFYQEELLPVSSFGEFCDVADLHVTEMLIAMLMQTPDQFVTGTLEGLP